MEWQWGASDCCAFAGEWIRRATGRDPFGRYRGRYASPLAAQRLIKRSGGFVPIVGMEMDECFERTQSPRDGDVGIIEAPVGLRDRMPVVGAIMAIRSGERWIARSAFGLQAGSYSTVSAWRIA